jgi:hypothetical protein
MVPFVITPLHASEIEVNVLVTRCTRRSYPLNYIISYLLITHSQCQPGGLYSSGTHGHSDENDDGDEEESEEACPQSSRRSVSTLIIS